MTDTKLPTDKDLEPVKFKLDREHEHKGETFTKDAVITLRRNQAERLAKMDPPVGKIVNG